MSEETCRKGHKYIVDLIETFTSITPLRRVIRLSGEIDVRGNLQKGTQAYSRFDRNIHKY